MVAVRSAEERIWHFGDFIVDADRRLLLRNEHPLAAGPKAFDLLAILLENRGRILSKQFLLDAVWPDAIVDVNNLNQQVAALRRLLDDSSDGWIETIPRVGFRFRAELAEKPNRARRWIAAFTVLMIALVLAAFVPKRRQTAKPNLRSLAVLPLRPDSGEAYLGLAVADALTRRFEGSKQLTIRPVSAIAHYVNQKTEPRAAGKELQVDAVIAGAISRSNNAMTATIRLIRVSDGKELWSHRFSSPAARLFSLPDDIYRAVANEIGTPAVFKTRYQPPAGAYEAYVKGRYDFSRRMASDLARAESSFRTALMIDPNYAAAWAGLSDALGFQGKGEEARIANERALELDDSLAEAHANLALGTLLNRYDFDLSRKEFERALALDPTNPQTHHWYAYYFVATGDFDRAFAEIETARRADPSSLIIQTDIGNILFRARRYDAAITQLRKVIQTDPTFAQGHHDLALVYEMTGRYDDSIREMLQARDVNDEWSRSAIVAQVYAAAGRTTEARRILERAKGDGFDYIAMAYAALGEKQIALDWLERAYAARTAEVALLNANPLFDPLRNEPRFAAIAQRIHP